MWWAGLILSKCCSSDWDSFIHCIVVLGELLFALLNVQSKFIQIYVKPSVKLEVDAMCLKFMKESHHVCNQYCYSHKGCLALRVTHCSEFDDGLSSC
jgi:hypothetical protein